MSGLFSSLISATELVNAISSGPCIILDCRSRLGEPDWGAQAYAQGHIPGAQFVSLDQDVAAPPDQRGRHPLPSPEQWVHTLRRLGVQNDAQVVVYDDAGGAYAARAWWMLRWVGHAAVAVLDGGLQRWSGALTTSVPEVPASHFEARPSLVKTVAAETLLELASGALLDARAEARWAGREEPIDAVAGHIPGALCLPFADNLDTEGCFKTPQALQARFAELPDPLVCYCGSGVTACHNILALHVIGREAALYADSWSGWITDPNRPVATA